MVTILDISMDDYVKSQLQAVTGSGEPKLEIHHSENTEDALKHLADHDIDVILVDVRVLPKLRKGITELLARTSLTTKIVLLESPDDMVDLEHFSHLGLKTISMPISLDQLQEVIG